MALQHMCIPDGRLRNCLRGVHSGRRDQAAAAAGAVSCSVCHASRRQPSGFFSAARSS